MVKNWCKKTPDHFRFTAKFPKVITHDKRLKDVEKELELFFSSMIYLEDKILALLIQLPPSMGIVEGVNGLRDIIPELDKRFRYAVEVRDSSWFQDLAYSFFANNNMCMYGPYKKKILARYKKIEFQRKPGLFVTGSIPQRDIKKINLTGDNNVVFISNKILWFPHGKLVNKLLQVEQFKRL